MMPLSAPDAQVIKLIRTPKLPESLFQNAQPVNIKVIASEGNQATILLAGRQLATQTNITLSVGQTLTAQPMLVNGQLQLKILQPSTPNQPSLTNQNTATTQNDNLTNIQNVANTKPNLNTSAQNTPLPSWTQTLPNSAKEALTALKNTLPNQLPLQQLLSMVNEQLQQANNKSMNPAWQTLLSQAMSLQTPMTAEKIQQSMQAFNDRYANQSSAQWKQAMLSLINNPTSSAEDKFIAQQLLNRSELAQQLQSLQHASGQAVWLQEIPLNHQQKLDNFTLEIDLPKAEQPEQEQHWKIFVQLNLAEGDFTSRIQLDKSLNLRLQLWGSNQALTDKIKAQSSELRKALTEQGLTVESLIVVQGKPEARTEKPLWQQPLVDCHG